jgi:hypothetical protein
MRLMSSWITRSRAVWIFGDTASREQLNADVYSAIGNTKENLNGFPQTISNIVVDDLEDSLWKS